MTGMASTTPNLSAHTQAARTAQKAWAARSIPDRLRHVERFRQAIVAARDRLCAVMGEEIDKPIAQVVSGEIIPTADACAFLCREADSILPPRSLTRKTRVRISR